MKQAGASPVYWVRTDPLLLEKKIEELLALINKPLLIVEGNSCLKYIHSDYSIFIANPSFRDFKESAWISIKSAHMILVKDEYSYSMEQMCRQFNKKGKIIFKEPGRLKQAFSIILKDLREKL